jgi:hypothetical protein
MPFGLVDLAFTGLTGASPKLPLLRVALAVEQLLPWTAVRVLVSLPGSDVLDRDALTEGVCHPDHAC